LLALLERAFRKPVKQLIAEESYTDKTKLLAIGGDIKHNAPGHYMDVLIDKADDTWSKLYIRQGEHVKIRIEYHKKRTVLKNKNALHYRLLRSKPSRCYKYVLLATIPEDEQLDTETLAQVLDVIEMYGRLLFQALPLKTLRKVLASWYGTTPARARMHDRQPTEPTSR